MRGSVRLAGLLGPLLAAACTATAGRNQPSFDEGAPTVVQLACGTPFEVREDAKHRALLISPGVKNLLGRSLEEPCQDARLGRLRPGELIFEVALEYLRRSGRSGCTIESHEAHLLGRLQVRYRCGDSPPSGSARKKARA